MEYKNPIDEEWEKFQKTMQQEEKVGDVICVGVVCGSVAWCGVCDLCGCGVWECGVVWGVGEVCVCVWGCVWVLGVCGVCVGVGCGWGVVMWVYDGVGCRCVHAYMCLLYNIMLKNNFLTCCNRFPWQCRKKMTK